MAEESSRSRRDIKRRRRFTEEFRRQVVEETLSGEHSIAGVALRHGLNNNLVFTWRRKYLRCLAGHDRANMLPVTIAPTARPVAGAEGKRTSRAVARGAIEIEWNGARIVVRGPVDAQALQLVLIALAGR